MQDLHLGRLAVSYGFLTEEQLGRCLDIQRRKRPAPRLGEILVAEGLLSEEHLKRLLGSQARKQAAQRGAPGKETAAVTGRSVAARTDDFLGAALQHDADAVHIADGSRPHIRVHGTLYELSSERLPAGAALAALAGTLDVKQQKALAERLSLDYVATLPQGASPPVRLRIAVYRHGRGLGAVIRRIPDSVPSVEKLELPEAVIAAAKLEQGLVLITGPRGSGKTTTLAALVELINRQQARHIITLEQPIEYRFRSNRSLIAQRQVGRDVPTCADGLRSCLREDPDVIVTSELTTTEEIATALSAAETGHLVFATLQTPNAYRTILRILDAYSGQKRAFIRTMLASSLRLVVSQLLVPASDLGRVHLATEVLTATPAVAALIREDRLHQLPMVMQLSRSQDMQLFDDSLAMLVKSGKIAAAEALARATDKELFASSRGA